jgi:hypothetical protein
VSLLAGPQRTAAVRATKSFHKKRAQQARDGAPPTGEKIPDGIGLHAGDASAPLTEAAGLRGLLPTVGRKSVCFSAFIAYGV